MNDDLTIRPNAQCPDCLRILPFASWKPERIPDEGVCFTCPACHYAVLLFKPAVAAKLRVPAMIVFRPGLYRHYTGKYYAHHRILFGGVDPENVRTYSVEYEPLYALPVGQPLVGCRAIADFFSPGDDNAVRYTYVGPMPPDSTRFDPKTGAPIN